jgi:uncharacterized protein (TIGR00288 family)
MDEKRETGIAVLIDGENVGASFAGKVLGILRSLGRIDIGNVYFDLQRGQSVEWIRDLPSLPLEPVVTAVEETGRSGSDISLVLDAVEILHTRDIGIFCICSSDGDFTGLARYLKAHGKEVIVAGNMSKTPSSLRVSCDRFIDISKPESAMAADLKSCVPAARQAEEDQAVGKKAALSGKASGPGQAEAAGSAERAERAVEIPELEAPESAADEAGAEMTVVPEPEAPESAVADGGSQMTAIPEAESEPDSADETGAGMIAVPEPETEPGCADDAGSGQLELSFGGSYEAPAEPEPQEEGVLPPETAETQESVSGPVAGDNEAPLPENAETDEQQEALRYRAAAAVRDILDESEGKSMDPSALQQRLRRRLPDFSVRKLGFRRFADFLVSLEGDDAMPQAAEGIEADTAQGDSRDAH